jgi:tRNA/tmRNA/rRNA uracil-C5-methylase (TrmA/RlmC/RlmD family)
VNKALIQHIVEQAQQRSLKSVWDLYCGSGNFLLPLLSAGLKGTGIERDLHAIASLKRAAQEQGLKGTFVACDALDWVQKQVHQGVTPPDLLICDPPRAGLKDALIPTAQVGARFIALCSCNPRSLARDLASLQEQGYLCKSLILFDMFEHTAQVEALAWLERVSAP